MNEARGERPDDWEAGWDAHEIAQLRRLAKLSFEEKLRWLEEADDLARRLARQRPRGRQPSNE